MAIVLKKSSNGYSKMEKEDPEEKNHRRAQFLIYKVMEQAESRKRTSYLRLRIKKLKVKIGKRLTKLRKSLNTARINVYRQVSTQLKTCKRLFGGTSAQTTLVPIFA
ncbi:hypothetical protein CsatB_012745 [Cannabis sativa]|uniref:Uncharacterized protein n=2 Tax=Cannabis sativa TaxID=3483 RepID=A0AB40ED44_CANSA|nr:uncharacterized protein LOC115706488 [Cannabis sativa]KAF4372529.1 hypothetical protein F8388_027202 [Cannabis sativa]KAF4399623.1 hypothetical protein G4B88_022706 [Cannabis sativa]